MKRVLRSCLDPLPRLISLQSLVAVVFMVIAGTGISVYEYLESAHLPSRHTVRAAAPEAAHETAVAPRSTSQDRSTCIPRAETQRSTQSRLSDWGAASRADDRDAASAVEAIRLPASAFEPCPDTAGS